MPIGFLFWIIWVFWFVFWGWGSYYGGPSWGHWIFLAAMLFLLGWHDFGFVVH